MANFNEHALEMSIMQLFKEEGYEYISGEQILPCHAGLLFSLRLPFFPEDEPLPSVNFPFSSLG